MKKLTKIATATTLGLGLSVSAMASENIQTTSNIAVQPSADLSYAFDDSQNLQVMAMTNQEMEDTEGALAPALVIYGPPVAFAVQRWAMSPAPQIWYHNIRQRF